jgi:polar amino acid transport system substrate-binding protein
VIGVWRQSRRALAVIGAAAALLCGPAAPLPSPPAATARTAAQAHLTAELKAGTGSATCDPTASLRPAGPATITPGSFAATIKAHGQLVVGVSASSYHFGYFNPLDGQIEGFDIDMLHAISAAIFGDPNKIRYVVVTDDERRPAIQRGEVDIVAETMTMTCSRWRQVDFSSEYLAAAQRVLVPRNSRATSLAGVRGRICAASGSTSLAFLKSYIAAEPVVTMSAVAVTTWPDCLVLLQEDKIAAISTDDTILAALQAQDPETKIIGPALSGQPYGLAISQQHPDFVRFVNAVLAKMRADGQWATIYKHWFGAPVPTPPPARYRD